MPKNIYKLKDGSVVPGVTTIIGQLDKPGLLDWAWELGKQGKPWREERDRAGDIGTRVHDLILNFLSGGQIVTTDESDVVMNCFDKFLFWWQLETKDCHPALLLEQPLISERWGFGGQPDIFRLDNQRLIDIKTSGGIYDSYWIQLAGYDILLREHGYKPKEYQIVWIPKDDRFEAPIRTGLKEGRKIFRHLLEVYKLRGNNDN